MVKAIILQTLMTNISSFKLTKSVWEKTKSQIMKKER